MTINMEKKIIFNFRIGDGGDGHGEKFTLKELGFDEKIHGNVEDFIEEEWKDWINNFIDGGWSFNAQYDQNMKEVESKSWGMNL